MNYFIYGMIYDTINLVNFGLIGMFIFYWNSSKLSIGTKGDIVGVQYNYFEDAMELKMRENLKQVVLYVAWIDMVNKEKEEIYTWFAADPAYDI